MIFPWLIVMTVGSCQCLNLAPVFINDMNQHPLTENTPIGTVIYTLFGTDPEGSPVTYGLEGTDLFRVDPISGNVTVVREIDRESHPESNEIRLTVIIEDGGGSNGRSNAVKVPISVLILDENDNEPIFRGLPYHTSVTEDTPIGTTVFRALEVTDVDLIGDVLDVQCVQRIGYPSDICDYFEIVPKRKETDHDIFRGSVVIRKNLNFRETQIYKIPISVFDGKFTVQAEVTIDVIDVQNTPPIFTGDGTMTGVVNEDDPIGTEVLIVKARDGDSGNPRRIVYDLIENPGSYFAIDSDTGQLRIDRRLDREVTNGVLILKVKATEIVSEYEPSSEIEEEEINKTESIADITITIRDVNDEPPTFTKQSYSVSIPENVPYGTPLANLDMEIRDLDTGPNSMFRIDLIDSSGKFVIEPEFANGHTAVSIKVNTPKLDYENPNERQFLLLVVATETDTREKLSSTASITVYVQDLNDNAPKFDKDSFTAFVSEDDPQGTEIVTITAKDRDSRDFGSQGIRYSLLGSGSKLFDVDPISGTILVAACDRESEIQCIDYERTKAYFLSYAAVDDNGEGKKTVVNLRISVGDANDNPPKFQRTNYSATIRENEVKFQPRLSIIATDDDESSVLHYSIIESPDNNNNNLFRIDSQTGEITVTDTIRGLRLDNLNTDVIKLNIRVSDGISTDTTLVSITVKDVNDRIPIFETKRYFNSVPETASIGTIVETVTATDADYGTNAEISYRIQSGSFDDFRIDSKSGQISVSGSLDYDRKNSYELEIIAVDHGIPTSLTGTATVSIAVMNKNDKIPIFVPSTQRVQITEDIRVGTRIYRLNVTDPDAERNTSLEYSIIEPITAVDKDGSKINELSESKDIITSFFAINSSSGDVYVNTELNRNVAAIVSLTVRVVDKSASLSPPFQEGFGTLIITIIDVNDFEPRFQDPWSPEQPYITIFVDEEAHNGTVVHTFVAQDADSNIDYFLIRPKNKYFSVERETGNLLIRNRIDYEAFPENSKRITFDLIVYDSGIPQKSANAVVIVNIRNINDEIPTFVRDKYSAEIPENSVIGTSILAVSAIDKDEGEFGIVTYTLSKSNSAFEIGSKSGIISVADSALLDREKVGYVLIQAIASDTRNKMSTVPINITILDVNDNEPLFVQPLYTATIVDNIPYYPNPSPIVQVSATDLDEGINGRLSYRILSGNENGRFYIDNITGIIFPNSSFAGLNGERFELVITVMDESGQRRVWETPDITRVIIDVENVNTHKPEWFPAPPSNETLELEEESDVTDFVILKVNARDRDSGENQRISYFLKVNNVNLGETPEFSMDENTGELRAKIRFDREIRSEYELVLVARDHGTPVSFETLRFVRIVIKDTNDNVPSFNYGYKRGRRKLKFTVPENEEPGYFVGKVEARDSDIGTNGQIYYYIIDGNNGREMSIDKIYGNIYTKMKLDRELVDRYILTIKASNDPDFVCDGSTCDIPIDNDDTTTDDDNDDDDETVIRVEIHVQDRNDNLPRFERDEFYVGVPFNAKIGDLILDAQAYDPDSNHGNFSYALRSSDLYPKGEIVSSGSLVPSPFRITDQGRLILSSLMAEFNQAKFVLDIEAKETGSNDKAKATINVWIYEPNQLIKLILNQSPFTVNQRKYEIIRELRNVTERTIVTDEIRYHVPENGEVGLRRDMTDMYLHVVDETKNEIMAPDDVIKIVDSNYERLHSAGKIKSIVPGFSNNSNNYNGRFQFGRGGHGIGETDSNIAALIALLLILFLGLVMFSILCCCIKSWSLGSNTDTNITTKNKPVRLQESPAIGYKTSSIMDDVREDPVLGGTIDNPLWIDQKYKAYEEQELTMTVFTDQENSVISGNQQSQQQQQHQSQQQQQQHSRQGSSVLETQSNAYATINKFPNAASMTARRTTLFNGSLGIEQIDHSERDYATLEKKTISRSPPGPVVPGIHPTSGTYQGSLPRRFSNEFTGPAAPVLKGSYQKSNLIINKHGEPELVADLM